ncbi:MAG: hypothetical protein Q7J34_09945 [Bacteroidales bacterium]|nr:hypothetical protein [Bacteroidales bacterium]
MKITLQLLTISILLTGLIGCGRVSQNEYKILKAENEKLKIEIDDLKFGPDKLLSQAKVCMDNEDFNKAKSELQTLLDKYPTSHHVTEAKQLVTIAENRIMVQKIADEKAKMENKKAEKERLANATKKLRFRYDDINDITWYYDKGTPQYTRYKSFHLYMGKEKTGRPWLRFRIQYAGDNWLFIQSYIIKTDNDSYTISTSYGEVETDHGSSGIWEWYDVTMDNRLYNIVKDVIKSKTVKLRHIGKQYYKDRTITEKEKQGLQNILDAYEALGGSTNF